ncbi:DNA methylase N-4/N-6 domain protein [mine drainage metagenome]|uniref:DNA methylase N-4/N-6 domain protein n=1 Tax=mine drainage metagenome TaxID=410659 RepID=T1A8T0_9ZZZZ
MSIRERHSDHEPSGTLLKSECLAALRLMPDDSVDSIVTDPPYELGFMNKTWDSSGIAYNVEFWTECLRVLKPGGHLLAAGGTRTYHRLACAIEDAGFEIRDSISWMYSTGFPKSLDVSKAIDKAAGAEREVLSSGKPVKRMISGADQNSTGSWIKDNGREFTPTETAPATPDAERWQGWGTAPQARC